MEWLWATWNFTMVNADRSWEGIGCNCSGIGIGSNYHEFSAQYFYDDFTSGLQQLSCTIIKIFLMEHNVRGQLPSSIGKLSNLTHLHFGENFIAGTIPNALTQ